MKKLLKSLLRHDRLKHFFFSFWIFVICALACELFGIGLHIAVMVTAIIGLVKEFYDGISHTGHADPVDWFYVVIPAVTMYLMLI